MKRHVNLMSEGAKFRAAVRKQSRRWAVALALLVIVLVPLDGMRWREQTRVRHEHEALEASYEPVRRLSLVNRQLRTEAINLVRDERLSLELAQQRPLLTLLARISAAASAGNGQIYVEQITVEQAVPGNAEKPVPNQVVVEAAATLTYDVSQFVESLKQPPITAVKVTSDVVTSENGVDRKNYTLECSY